MLCGVKVIVSSLLHASAHLFHINVALRVCKNGCSRDKILIVPRSDIQVIISYNYFFRQYPYITGVILIALLALGCTSAMLHAKKKIRWTSNRILHQYIAIIFIILTIAHGGSHLLGFNYSYILIAPALLCYCWHRRHLIITRPIKISRWVCTPSMIRIYICENNHIDNVLESFANVSISLNHPAISKTEWHPFTLSRGYGPTEAAITMKRIGKWTNALADELLARPGRDTYINIGNYARSKFRFHRFYRTRYFFCAGIGITGFMATASDMLRSDYPAEHTQTILAWSVSDPRIVSEFSQQLVAIQRQMPNIKILIFYSNRAKITWDKISYTTRARFDYLQTLIFGLCNIDIVSKVESPICMIFQRVDFIKILSRVVGISNGQDTIGVFICGPDAYAKHATNCVAVVGRTRPEIDFRIWSEAV
jgi:ferredoxin-NADP reductase